MDAKSTKFRVSDSAALLPPLSSTHRRHLKEHAELELVLPPLCVVMQKEHLPQIKLVRRHVQQDLGAIRALRSSIQQRQRQIQGAKTSLHNKL